MPGQLWTRTANGSTYSGIATQFMTVIGGPQQPSADNTERFVAAPVSSAGVINGLYVKLRTAPGTGNSLTFTVSVNQSPTAISVALADAATSGSSLGSVAVSAGDIVTIKSVGSGATSGITTLSILFTPTATNAFCYPIGLNGSITAAGVYWPALHWETSAGTASTIAEHSVSVIPYACTLTALAVYLTVAPGAGKSWDFAIHKNNAEEATTVLNIADTAQTGTLSGLSVAVAAGDLLSFTVKTKTGTASTTRVGYSVTLVPTAGAAFIYGSGGDATTFTQTTYVAQLGQGTSVSSTTEANVQVTDVAVPLKLSNLQVRVETAPGAGNSWTVTQRKNGSNNLTLSAAITGTGVTGSDASRSDLVAIGDEVHLVWTEGGTATGTAEKVWSMAAAFSGIGGSGSSPGGKTPGGKGGGKPGYGYGYGAGDDD